MSINQKRVYSEVHYLNTDPDNICEESPYKRPKFENSFSTITEVEHELENDDSEDVNEELYEQAWGRLPEPEKLPVTTTVVDDNSDTEMVIVTEGSDKHLSKTV